MAQPFFSTWCNDMAKIVTIDLNSDVVVDPPDAQGNGGTKVKLKDHIGALRMKAQRTIWTAYFDGAITEAVRDAALADVRGAKNWGQLKKAINDNAAGHADIKGG